jgi:hypothetical protein
MAISLVAVGAKVTAAIANAIISAVNAQGMTRVVPTSVAGTGVSVSATGTVTVAAGSIASLNGVFSANYENYLIVVKASTIADRLSARLRLSGTDAPNIYSNQTVQGAVTTASAATNGATAASIILANVASPIRTKAIVNLMAVALAEVTDVLTQAYTVVSTTSMAVAQLASSANNTTAYDGISVFPDTGTWSGKIWVYGYNTV